jgi:hypothetical protein
MVNFEELDRGDLLEIKGETFEVMKVVKKTNPSPRPGAALQMYLSIELKKQGDPHIFPTAFLQYYPDTGNLLLVDNIKLTEKDIKLKEK